MIAHAKVLEICAPEVVQKSREADAVGTPIDDIESAERLTEKGSDPGLTLYQTPFRAGSYSLAENFTRDRSGLRKDQRHVNA